MPHDADNLSTLVERNMGRIQRIASSFAFRSSVSEAEDLAQQAVLRILELFERKTLSFENDEAFIVFARSVLWKVLQEHFAKQRIACNSISLRDDVVPDLRSSELDVLINDSKSKVLVSRISKLPKRYRAVMELYVEGLTDAEIAEFLQLTEAAVRQRRKRAKEQLAFPPH